jgi:hypothetical protein
MIGTGLGKTRSPNPIDPTTATVRIPLTTDRALTLGVKFMIASHLVTVQVRGQYWELQSYLQKTFILLDELR